MKSLKAKMDRAYQLALKVCYSEFTPERTCLTTRWLPEKYDLAWTWADGLMHRYAKKRMDGQCSLTAFLEFNLAEFEKEVDHDITVLEAALKEFGEPVVLTKKEMKRRGYNVDSDQ